MTKEQWLVYLYGIWPNGGVIMFWFTCLIISGCLIGIFTLNHFDSFTKDRQDTFYTKMGKWKVGIPAIFAVLILISSLVPTKQTFMYIIATPYLVDGSKSIVDSLQDPTSKLSKINTLLDKSLDKALTLVETENKK